MLLLVILVTGMLGTAAELLLVSHTEDAWQWAPLVLIALALPVLAWHVATGAWRAGAVNAKGGAASLRVLHVLMVLFIASGLVGMWLHIGAKIEFKQESDPSLSGFALFYESLKSQMPPALAPGMMIQLGLMGLAYAYGHPALRSGRDNDEAE